jgi:hypothetical protein
MRTPKTMSMMGLRWCFDWVAAPLVALSANTIRRPHVKLIASAPSR